MLKKTNLLILGLLISSIYNIVYAQSRVFKDVESSISTTVRTIVQDNHLMGYLLFTELEKISADSLNYRINILDENLNDIGKIEFKDQKLVFHDLAFDGDIICLGFLKSNFIGKTYKRNKEFKEMSQNAKNSVYLQFLNLEGKIIKKIDKSVEINNKSFYNFSLKLQECEASLPNGLQITNLPQKGFACFYSDLNNNLLYNFSSTGEEAWSKKVANHNKFHLLTHNNKYLYLLSSEPLNYFNRTYTISGFNITDGKAHTPYPLVDESDKVLRILNIQNDPISNNLCISGNVYNKKAKFIFNDVASYTKNQIIGTFTTTFKGEKKSDINTKYNYWNDKSMMPLMSSKGRIEQEKAYFTYSNAFVDHKGDTYFAGSKLIKKTRTGLIISSILLAPTLYVPMVLALKGTYKYKCTDAMLLKQNSKGELSVATTIPLTHTSGYTSRNNIKSEELFSRTFTHLADESAQKDYLILKDEKNYVIYNVSEQKVVKTIPRKENKNNYYGVYPAKEGHIMISEYNEKEKTRRLSIEMIQ